MNPFLLITGMHRSGTSFLARALNLHGVYLGELESLISHEWKPLEDNPKGHWENKKIYELTEQTLKDSKGSWHNVPKKIYVNKKIGSEIKKCVNHLQDNSILAAGLKDPRLLLCFEEWVKYLPKNFVVIGIIRNPLEVAESLKKRNDFDYEKSLNLWKIYNQKLLEILEKYDGFLLDFDWPKKKLLDEIKVVSKKLDLAKDVDLSEWYTKDLLKSNASYEKNYALPKDVKDLYAKLKKRTNKNKYVKTKKVKQPSKQISATVGNLLADIQNQGKYLKSILDQRDKELVKNIKKITSLQKEYDERSQWATSLDNDLKQSNEKLAKLQKEYDERSQWATSLDNDLKQSNEKLAQLQKEYDERSQWATSLDSDLKQKNERILQLQNEFDERSKQAEVLHTELEERKETITKLQKENDERTKNIEELDKKAEEVQKIIQTKQAQLQNVQNELDAVRAELNEIKNSVLYGITSGIARKLDKLAPEETRRRNALKLTSAAYLMRKERGTGTLIGAAKEKMRDVKPRFGKSSKKKPQFLETIKDTKIDFHSNILKIEETFEPDPSLRKAIQFGAHNITNLEQFPKVSIIITTFNQLEALKRNLDSIKSKSTYKNYEIIIVTNNRDENSEMRKYLKTIDDTVCVYDEEYSFGGMNNFGASKATGEFLLFLNDDIEVVTPNWLEALLSLGLLESTGAVGPKLLSPNGKLQDCGGIVWKNEKAWNYGRFHDPEDPKFNYVRDVDYCSGSCLFVKKEIFDKVGGFDRKFDPAYWEDTDLCFAIRQLGYSVLYQPQCRLVHYEGLTQGVSTDKGLKSYQVVNQKKFYEKWRDTIENYLDDSAENSFFERDRRQGLNILYIDHYVPEPDKDSGSLRTFNILGVLSHMKNKVTFWPDNQKYSAPYVPELQQKGIEVIYRNKYFGKFLKKRKQLYDVAILARPYISVKYVDTIKKMMPECKIIYDTIDLHFLRMEREAAIKEKGSSAQADMMRKLELSMMKKSDVTILTSPAEAKVLHDEDKSFRFAILPNIHIECENVESFDERKNMIFVGGFQHTPNIDSVKYLVGEIWPLIKNRLDKAKLYIIGSGPPEEIKKLASDDVKVTGFVQDLEPYYSDCTVNLAPLRFGAGVKGKITQSLAMGLPVVTTTVGAEGMELADGQNCMIADTPDEFAKKAVQVYTDKELWGTLSRNGVILAKEYSPERARACLAGIISSII